MTERKMITVYARVVCGHCSLEPAEVKKMQAKLERQAKELKRLRAAIKAALAKAGQ